MAPRHRKHCTFKKTQVCICPNLEAALNELEAKHKEELLELREIRHLSARRALREQMIEAFTNLIDGKFVTEPEPCSCSRYDYY